MGCEARKDFFKTSPLTPLPKRGELLAHTKKVRIGKYVQT